MTTIFGLKKKIVFESKFRWELLLSKIDLSESPSYYSDVEWKNNGNICSPVYSNGIVTDNLFLLVNHSSIDLLKLKKKVCIKRSYRMIWF